MYDSDDRLTIEGAKQVIQSGGSVLIGGVLHNDVRTLPSAAKLSALNAVTRKQAERGIELTGKFTYKGKTYTDPEDLPKPEEFAAENRKAQQEAREQLQKEIDDRQKQLDEADKLDQKAAQASQQAAALRSGTRTGGGTVASEDLNELTVADLHERAKAVGVEGYSTLHKDDLVKAVRKAEKKG